MTDHAVVHILRVHRMVFAVLPLTLAMTETVLVVGSREDCYQYLERLPDPRLWPSS